jgi:hypothetical protein
LSLYVALLKGKHFGTMGLGTSTVCAKDGLVPMRFDASFRKSLGMFYGGNDVDFRT